MLFTKNYTPWNKNKKLTEEHKANLRIGRARYFANGGVSPLKGKKHTESAKQKNREKHLGKPSWNKGLHTNGHKNGCSCLFCKPLSRHGENNPFFGKKHTEASKENMRKSMKGRIPWSAGKSKETDERLAIIGKKGAAARKLRPATEKEKAQRLVWRKLGHTPEARKKAVKAFSLHWKDPSYRDRVLTKIFNGMPKKINKLEKKIQDLLGIVCPNMFTFSGVGGDHVGGYFPDFISRDSKKIIECYGNFWHALPSKYPSEKIIHHGLSASDIWKRDLQRISFLEKNGFDVLIIWEHEVKDSDALKNKLNEFINKRRKDNGISPTW